MSLANLVGQEADWGRGQGGWRRRLARTLLLIYRTSSLPSTTPPPPSSLPPYPSRASHPLRHIHLSLILIMSTVSATPRITRASSSRTGVQTPPTSSTFKRPRSVSSSSTISNAGNSQQMATPSPIKKTRSSLGGWSDGEVFCNKENVAPERRDADDDELLLVAGPSTLSRKRSVGSTSGDNKRGKLVRTESSKSHLDTVAVGHVWGGSDETLADRVRPASFLPAPPSPAPSPAPAPPCALHSRIRRRILDHLTRLNRSFVPSCPRSVDLHHAALAASMLDDILVRDAAARRSNHRARRRPSLPRPLVRLKRRQEDNVRCRSAWNG